MIRPAVGAAIFLSLLLIGCEDPSTGARETIELGGETWTVLEGGDDGMRGRTGFAGADAMLFTFADGFDTRGIVWVMDGVAFPLDIAWFDHDGALVGTASMAVCPAAPCPTYAPDRPYRWAIEAPVGAFDRLRPDDRLDVPDA